MNDQQRETPEQIIARVGWMVQAVFSDGSSPGSLGRKKSGPCEAAESVMS